MGVDVNIVNVLNVATGKFYVIHILLQFLKPDNGASLMWIR